MKSDDQVSREAREAREACELDCLHTQIAQTLLTIQTYFLAYNTPNVHLKVASLLKGTPNSAKLAWYLGYI